MAFGPFRVKIDEVGIAEIPTASAALIFVEALRPEVRAKPHWRVAESMIRAAHMSTEHQVWAALAFEDALIAEDWLVE